MEFNVCVVQELQWVDVVFNVVYCQVLVKYVGEVVVLEKIKVVQWLWI